MTRVRRHAVPRALGRACLGALLPAALHAQPATPATTPMAAAEPTRVAAQPGAFTVVSVAVPAALVGAEGLRYRVEPTGGARVLAPLAGPVSGRAVPVTVSLAGSAPAGVLPVATVLFEAPGRAPALVPVEVVVAAAVRLNVALVDLVAGARPGDLVTLRWRAVNVGNRADTVRVTPTYLPPGWRVAAPAIAVVPVRGTHEGTLTLWVPAQAPPGLALVRTVATVGGTPVAQGEARIEVEGATGRGDGLALGVGLVGAAGAGGVAHGLTLALDGALADSLHLSLRAARVLDAPRAADAGEGGPSAGTRLALGRAGVVAAPPAVQLAGRGWRLGAGATGTALGELTGGMVAGRGATLTLARGGWALAALGATPLFALPGSEGGASRGRLLALRATHAVGDARVSVSAARLHEPGVRRALDAVGVGAALDDTPLGDVQGEVALRRGAGGAGVGSALAVRHQGDAAAWTLRAAFAPGGSQGYARAREELSAAASRRVARGISLAGACWRTGDASVGGGALRSQGWSAGPSASLARGRLTAVLEARGHDFAATSRVGRIGGAERQGALSVDARRGAWYATGGALVARTRRETALAPVGDSAAPGADRLGGARAEQRLAVGAAWQGATVEVGATAQQTDGTLGALATSHAVQLRADRVSLPRLARWMPALQLGGEVQRLTLPAFGAGGLAARAVTSTRVALTLPLRRGLGVSLGAERGPFVGAPGGGWITTLRIDRLERLPRFAVGPTRRVFRDLNGNGRRDAGEPGAAGLIVRCAGRTAVTGRDGRFDCPGQAAAEVDVRALPAGWIAPPTRAAAPAPDGADARRGVRRAPAAGDLALVAIAPAVVQLRIADHDTLRVPWRDVAKIVVLARDSAGRPWVARPDSLVPGAFVFDALPTGRYAIDVDASALAEPLRAVSAERTLVVAGAARGAPLELLLRGRAVRVRQLGGAASPVVAAPAVVAPAAPGPTR